MDQAPVASRAMPLETRRHRDDPARPVSVSFFERDLYKFLFDLTDGGNWLVDVHASS